MCQNNYFKWCYMKFTWVFFFFKYKSCTIVSFPHKTDFLSVYCTIGHMNNSIFLGSLNMIQPYELCPHWNHNKYQVIAYQTNIRRHSESWRIPWWTLQPIVHPFFFILQNWTLFLNLRCGTSHTSVSLAFS